MNEKEKLVSRVAAYIEAHLEEPIPLDQVARHTGYSKFHLNRMFRETAGCTIHQYIRARRLTKAAEKLVRTDAPIAEIAYEAQYESQQAFTLAFGRFYGCSPLSYRRQGIFASRQKSLVTKLSLVCMSGTGWMGRAAA